MLRRRFWGCKTMTGHLCRRGSLCLLLSILALAVVLGGSVARADDLSLAGSYNTFNFVIGGSDQSVGGGEVGGSADTLTIGSTTIDLAYVYCVDIWDVVYVPGNYTATTTTHTASVTEESHYSDGLTSPTSIGAGAYSGTVNHAGQVAWLLDTYATGAEGSTAAQEALQAAIWHTIYGSGYDLSVTDYASNTTIMEDYTADLAALGSNTDSTANLDWFSPGISGSSTVYQALVAGPGPVPEPASIVLLGGVLLMVGKALRRRLA